jgi:hypothetical protein
MQEEIGEVYAKLLSGSCGGLEEVNHSQSKSQKSGIEREAYTFPKGMSVSMMVSTIQFSWEGDPIP